MPLGRAYQAYGVTIKSALALPCEEEEHPATPDIEIRRAPSRSFMRIEPDGATRFQRCRRSDGTEYLRWSGLFECLVSADGRTIRCHHLSGSTSTVFQTFLAGQIISFALLKLGLEPLHATTVIIDSGAVAFVGDCGYGKSSLGAAFLRAGCPLLTDDLLVLKETAQGFSAYPGLPRIKLFPETAKMLLGEQIHGIPMTSLTPKLVISLDREQSYRLPAPLKAIYVLKPPTRGSRRRQILIRPLSARAAFVELLRNTFNPMVVEAERLQRQLDLAARLASKAPVKSLSVPWTLDGLPAVCEAVQADLAIT